MTTELEATLEHNFIKELLSCGYQRSMVNGEELLRQNLRLRLQNLNDCEFSEDEWYELERILTKGIKPIDKAKQLRSEIVIERKESANLYIKLLDRDNWSANVFEVTNQFVNENQGDRRRYDVTLLVNGLPLIQIELKRKGVELSQAFNQIKQYLEVNKSYSGGRGYFQYVQQFVISNGVNTKYIANSNTASLNPLFAFKWTDEGNNPMNDLLAFSRSYLNPEHLHKMLLMNTVITKNNTMLVLRPYQCYAVQNIVNRVNEGVGNGYIWHTTGSGKTLTSFKASQILAGFEEIKKVVFVVDRKDLDTQTVREFNEFSEGAFKDSKNTNALVQSLKWDQKLIVTTIQKLNKAARNFSKSLAHLKEERVVFIFDECHRSQFGTTHKHITDFFQGAQLIGFTGTPIFAENSSSNEHGKRTTADLFDKCLHKYLLPDAIEDANVLPFRVDYVGKYKSTNGIDDDVEVTSVDTKEVLESEKRLIKVRDYILQHHNRYTTDKRFNSIFAAPNIPVLCRYYELFREANKQFGLGLKLAVVFSYGDNEEFYSDSNGENERQNVARLSEYLNDYNKEHETAFDLNALNGYDDYNRHISLQMKAGQIDILLVVNMYLTGFDAVKLNTLYVDKNLKHHGLIQSFSRTNRLFTDKNHGNIVCFRNLKENTDEAVALFSNNEPNEHVILPEYDILLERVNAIIEKLKGIVPTVQTVDELRGASRKKEFINEFRRLLRNLKVLKSCPEFSYRDLLLSEQEIADYQSKYLDLATGRGLSEEEKESIVDEIDFEIERLHTEYIDFDYIELLLKNFVNLSSDKQRDLKQEILTKLASEPKLYSKRELIEQFIESQLIHIDDPDTVEEAFVEYVATTKENVLSELAAEFEVNVDAMNRTIDYCLWQNNDVPSKGEIKKLLPKEKPLMELLKLQEGLSGAIKHFIDVYCVGWT